MKTKTRTDRRTLSSSLSSDVLKWLLARNYSQADIARLLGVSEPFISLVKSRERSFTLDHMNALAEALQTPLGALLLSITEREAKTPEQKEMKELTRRLMHKLDLAAAAAMEEIKRRAQAE